MASTSSWMPPPGRHNVNIGSSLGRAIKNRKLKGSPAPTTKRSNLPERDFYSFKFNFKASSIDASKNATIDIKQGTENAQIRAEFPSTQAGEVHTFNGTEIPARDVDCILIYDEDTGQYTLEKLESYVTLKFDRKMMVTPRPASPAPAAAGKGKAKQEDFEMASAVEEEEEGEADADVDDLLRQTLADEPEEGEEIEIPLRITSPPKPQPAPPPAKARPTKPLPQSRVERSPKVPSPPAVAAAPPPPPAVRPKAKGAPAKTKKTKAAAAAPPPPPPTLYPDEEVIEFGNSQKPAKRARPSPPQPPPPPPRARSPVSLSFPGGTTPAFAPPPAPVLSKPTTSRNIPPPIPAPQPTMPPSPQMVQSDSDDDDENWEEVPTATVPSAIPQAEAEYEASLEKDIFGDFGDADGDAGEDIDDLEKMMIEQMERDSDDEADMVAVTPEPDPNRQPISLNKLASGGIGAVDSDDDDFSSSDESDED